MLATYHVLPEAGGWHDQDADRSEDMLTWLHLVAVAESEKDDKGQSSDPFEDIGKDDGSLDISSMMG